MNWTVGPRLQQRLAANISADFKLTSNLTLALRSSYTDVTNTYYHAGISLRAWNEETSSPGYFGPAPNVHPESSLVEWIVDPTHASSNNTSLYTANSMQRVRDVSYVFSPRLIYKTKSFEAVFRGGITRSNRDYTAPNTFNSSENRIGGIGWTATRPDGSSPEWTLVQTAGTDWSQQQNWNRHSTYANGVSRNPGETENTQSAGYLDLTKAVRLFNHPVTFRAGAGIRHSTYRYERQIWRGNYYGPTSVRTRRERYFIRCFLTTDNDIIIM
jgi:hypothetical protein